MAMRFAPLLVLLAMAALTVAVPMRSKSRCLREFERWAQKHAKVYADAPTYRRRLEAFCISLKEVEQINSRPGITWTAALNQYSDMTWAEFKSAKLMAEQNCSATITTPVEELVKMGIVADEFDWRNQTCGETSCVSMVKNQGTCGSCWTFSTAAALESLHAIKTGKMVLLSEQQLVDCAADFKNHGCNGGLPSQAFEYVMYNGGLSKMEDYPYVCGDGHCNVTGGPCAFDPAGKPWSVGATMKVLKVANFTPGDEISMKTVVGSHNPISVAFEVMERGRGGGGYSRLVAQVVPDLRHYSSGVYSSTTCVGTPDKVNHAVLAVGYGTEGGVTYWTIKNSWGFGWGDNGYFKIQRGNNMCGISVCASFPITSDK